MTVRRCFVLLACVLAARVAWCGRTHARRHAVRFATFNIEDFPKDERQVAGAFDEIARLDASFVAVQGIGDADRFARAAREQLGASWRFVAEPGREDATHRLGLAFDAGAWELVSSRTYDDTRVGGRNKATLEVRLRPRGGGAIVRALVVHFRSGTAGRATRARQHEALARILARIGGTDDRVVVLGDFNATEPADRDDIERDAERAGLAWATEALACTAFWARDDGCPRSRLDHVLAWTTPARVAATGACATDGCARQDSCPLYAEQVSDHCPVVVAIDE